MVNRKRGGRSKAAAEAVASHSDLLSEILLRLPARSLIKFKRVSREWYSLISGTQFYLEHTRRNLNPEPIGIFLSKSICHGGVRYVKLQRDYCVKNYSTSICKFPKGLFVLDCCNGLFLCSCNGLNRWDARSKLYVCNPTTKHVATIPHLFKRERFFKSLILCFDPSTSEKYSVICLWNNIEQCFAVDVYESKTGSWRHSGTFSEHDYPISPECGGVFWNGAVHWVSYGGYALYSFDLNQECFRRSMVLPNYRSKGGFDIQTCQGHLYVSKFDKVSCPFKLTVYEIERDFSSLSVKYTIRHEGLAGSQMPGYVSVLGIFLGEECQAFIVLRIGFEVYTYNASDSNSVPSHKTLSGKFLTSQCMYGYMFTESLALI